MKITEAKPYLGRRCAVTFHNRQGDEITRNLHICDIEFVPLYGTYVIGDTEDICLDRVTAINNLD